MATRTLSDAEKAILGSAATEKMGETETVSDQSTEETSNPDVVESVEETKQAEVEQFISESSQAPNVEQQGTEDNSATEQTSETTTIENAAPTVVTETKPETTPTVPQAMVSEPSETFGLIGQRVMSILNAYADKMAPRKPVSDAVIIEQQRLLFEAILKTINDSGEDFEKLMKKVLAFFEQHKNGVFHETRVFRGMDSIPLSQNDRTAFTRLLNLFKLVANPQSRKLAIKQVDLHASLQYGVTEQGKNRLLTFFNQ